MIKSVKAIADNTGLTASSVGLLLDTIDASVVKMVDFTLSRFGRHFDRIGLGRGIKIDIGRRERGGNRWRLRWILNGDFKMNVMK